MKEEIGSFVLRFVFNAVDVSDMIFKKHVAYDMSRIMDYFVEI